MNESPDPLEMELAGMEPAPLPDGFARVVVGRSRRPRVAAWLAMAAAVAVIALASAKFLTREIVHPVPIAQPTVVMPTPSLAAYNRAIARSPEALDAMLDADARRATAASPIHAFGSVDDGWLRR